MRSRAKCGASALLAGLLAGCTLPPQPGDSSPSSEVTAFVGVTVLSMVAGEAAPQLNQTVVVEDDRIANVGPAPSVEVPAGARRVDGAGSFLMPGLADMHVHLEYFTEPTVLAAFLANGVTTVRNMDGRPYILDWKRQTASGDLLGPTIYTAGPLLDGDPPLRPDNTIVRDAEDARSVSIDTSHNVSVIQQG